MRIDPIESVDLKSHLSESYDFDQESDRFGKLDKKEEPQKQNTK